MSGFDYLNELLRKHHDVNALGRATHLAGLSGRGISTWTEDEVQHVAECYLKTAKFPSSSLHASKVTDEQEAL